MRRIAVAVVAALFVLLGAPAAGADVEVVTVEGGPVSFGVFAPQCNDIAFVFDEQRSFVLHRTGPATEPLTVAYQLSGTAQPGVHFEPLPGSVTFPPGATSVTVDVVPRPSPGGALVDLTMTAHGDSATIRFVSPAPPGPVECGYFFTDDAWNTSQTVAVGEPLHALTLEEFRPPMLLPATGRFRVVGGSLPPGVTLNEDGSFTGVALLPGTYTSRIEACRPEPPGTCITTDLTVTVENFSFDGFAGAVAGVAATIVQQAQELVRQLLAGFGFG